LEEALSSIKKEKHGVNEKERRIEGLISVDDEILLLEKHVIMEDKAEKWLSDVEKEMTFTVGRLINMAITSFPIQSLDEWILDFPQQVILTTIHLILTHEINELFSPEEPEIQSLLRVPGAEEDGEKVDEGDKEAESGEKDMVLDGKEESVQEDKKETL
jgi:hypothetical protein